MELHKIIKVSHAVACPFAFLLFYEPRWQGGVFKIMKTYHFLSVFSHLGHFPIAQVKQWLILGLYEMIKVPHAVVCPMEFNLLYY